MSDVTLELDGHVAVVEMHRPPANFFDRVLLQEVADAAEQAQSSGARAIVLCSEGKHFCAGASLGDETGRLDPRAAATLVYEQGRRLFALEIPVVAAVQGAAVGGGLGLACAADFRVASAATRFEANFSRLGFHHGFALSATLPRLVGVTYAELMLTTGRRVLGEEAHRVGLVQQLAPEGAEREVALDLAREIAAAAPLAVRSIRATLRGGLADQVEQALNHELDEQEWLWRTEDCAIGITSSLERHEPTFVGR